jgi:acid phosphatase class B
MNIALDYDGTYTNDPQAWNEFIDLMQRHGHSVYVVTMRTRAEARDVYEQLEKRVDGIFCTSRKAKRPFMFARGINISVWIDDEPGWILTDAADAVQHEG